MKGPNPIDVHVGSRVRLRRTALGISQERLGRQLGLTFQQVQKYEKGANRIGASRLYAIARALDAPVQYFFEDVPASVAEGLPGAAMNPAATPPPPGETEPNPTDFASTAEGLELNRSFQRITDQATRRHLAELVRSVAGEG